MEFKYVFIISKKLFHITIVNNHLLSKYTETKQKIPNLVDNVHKHLRTFEQQGHDIQNCPVMFIFWLTKKTKPSCNVEWADQTCKQDDLPTLVEFLELYSSM